MPPLPARAGCAAPQPAAPDADGRPTVVLTGVSSDAHTWNLVYLRLLLEELGWEVVNLGATTPDGEVIEACLRHRPQLLVVSSVNGHGHIDGVRLITALREVEELFGIPAVIGGKLGVAGEVGADRVVALLAAGFDAVFQDGVDIGSFTHYLSVLAGGPLAVTR
ncbi:methylaspartate mutase sigma subunit [Kitasatospora sp. MAP12-15]|uniref:cobalamin B12-binding domain-containing protein n=1 Tax=unclassified Kitasatospora TaxID=2633591 RepID=UPI00247689F8|nr:cobalamin-dependent protein [Kitasatospora sp. MAP12-44]MDH6108601.1 methylaspartate mutase sigma subunit [Kitasatospora sp. MAP12-44]